MQPPNLFWNRKDGESLTGIFIPMSGDEVLNLHVALQLRASGVPLLSNRTITEVAMSYSAFELALMDLDAKISFVMGVSDNAGSIGANTGADKGTDQSPQTS